MAICRTLGMAMKRLTLSGAAILLLQSMLLSSCSTKALRVREYQVQPSASSIPNSANGQSYLIGPGDVLEVVVWKVPSVSGSARVRPDGYITLPLINEVQAVGVSPARLRETLEKQYRDFITDPFVTIRVEQITSTEIFVIGEVNKPGAYPWRGNDTVIEVLTRAGGLTPYAERANIRVVRREGEKVTEYTVDYNAILKGDLQQDIALKTGDRILVP
jgi:polysaccharide export outer membrane protein